MSRYRDRDRIPFAIDIILKLNVFFNPGFMLRRLIATLFVYWTANGQAEIEFLGTIGYLVRNGGKLPET